MALWPAVVSTKPLVYKCIGYSIAAAHVCSKCSLAQVCKCVIPTVVMICHIYDHLMSWSD